jgi:plasmid stabilization system protein ParE
VKVVVREAAARDLDDILDWISRDSPRAAAELVRRILTCGDIWPESGKPHLRHVRERGDALWDAQNESPVQFPNDKIPY